MRNKNLFIIIIIISFEIFTASINQCIMLYS